MERKTRLSISESHENLLAKHQNAPYAVSLQTTEDILFLSAPSLNEKYSMG